MNLRFRFFVEGRDAAEAKTKAEALLDRIGAHLPRPSMPELVRYKDIPRWHEGRVEVAVPEGKDPREVAKKIGESAASGWRWVRDGDAGIVSTDLGSEISLDGVRWIEIDVLRPEDSA